MVFQALHEIVRIHDGFGNIAENVGVHLHLMIQIAGEVGEVQDSFRVSRLVLRLPRRYRRCPSRNRVFDSRSSAGANRRARRACSIGWSGS